MDRKPALHVVLAVLVAFVCVPAFAMAGMNGQTNKKNKKKRQNQLSANNTAFRGAELLSQGKQVDSGKVEAPKDKQSATAYWSGDTLNLEVKSKEGNRVALKVEFFWFEATMKRGSDFYVAIVRGNSSPNIGASGCTVWGSGAWSLSTPTKIRGKHEPAQFINIKSTQGGNGGAIRWDWSIPFQTYRYEPKQDVTIEQHYSLNAGANAQGSVEGSAGIEADGKEIQGKGSLGANGGAKASHKVSTDYTITLYRWEMQVSSGPGGIEWGLMPLDPKKATDNAYHEYYLAVQSQSRGKPAVIPEITFGGTFDCQRASYLPDKSETLKATVKNIKMSPPPKANCTKHEQFKNGKCVPKCGKNKTLKNGKCVADCAPGETLKGGTCVPKCGPNQTRKGGTCVPDCNPNETLKNGKCLKQCSVDADCGQGKVCLRGLCRGPTCAKSSDCGKNQVCDSGRCRTVQCKSSNDCNSGEICNSAGTCVKPPSRGKQDAGHTGSSPDAGSTGGHPDTGSTKPQPPPQKADTGTGVGNSRQNVSDRPSDRNRVDTGGGFHPFTDTGTGSSKSKDQGQQYRYDGGGCSSTGSGAPAGGFLMMALFGLVGLIRRRTDDGSVPIVTKH